jgi:catechol 2,3-dioxygenase-like lactoylglutathione lyase family enzyme
VSAVDTPRLHRLLRFSLTTGNIGRLAVFYQQAFECRALGAQHVSGGDFQALMGVTGGAQRMTLQLGYELIELLQFDRPGQPYPPLSLASDLWFQHFAIVVSDMETAFARLSRVKGWTAISTRGPESLPASSGGVSAFKFRDPDGHPLELLAFAPDHVPAVWKPTRASAVYLGIDHSAISVADSDRSSAFYAALGLSPGGHTLNQGVEQARLDGLSAPEVEVSAWTLEQGVAHLELLCYRGAARGRPLVLNNNDIAATRLIFETEQALPGIAGARSHRALVDPDGHHLQLVSPAALPVQNG